MSQELRTFLCQSSKNVNGSTSQFIYLFLQLRKENQDKYEYSQCLVNETFKYNPVVFLWPLYSPRESPDKVSIQFINPIPHGGGGGGEGNSALLQTVFFINSVRDKFNGQQDFKYENDKFLA